MTLRRRSRTGIISGTGILLGKFRRLPQSAPVCAAMRESATAVRFRCMNPVHAHSTSRPLAAFLLLAVVCDAHAAEIAVSTTQDLVGLNGLCSLREAISNANADQALIIGVGECIAGSGPDLITLPPGTYAITRAGVNEDFNATGDFDLRSSITIAGASAAATRITGNLLDRVLHVSGDGLSVTLRRLSISLGAVPDGPESIVRAGGGVLAAGASTTTLDGVVVEVNSGGSRTASTGLPGDTGHGGGVACSGSGTGAGRLVLRDTIVRLNSAGNARAGGSDSGNGGGVYGIFCQLEINRSRIANNRSGDGVTGSWLPGDGGGIAITGGTLDLVDSVISDNVVGANGTADGGGIAGIASSASVRGSSVVGNRAHRGGGIFGGVTSVLDGLVLSVRNSTFSGNMALTGGAIHLRELSELVLQATTLADNSASSGGAVAFLACAPGDCRFTLANNAFVRNGDNACDLDGEIDTSSGGFNAFEVNAACGPAQATDLSVLGNALGALDEIYAATPSYIPPADSPLIDAGSCAAAGTVVDQAGTARPQQYPAADAADGCDIGAIERRSEVVFGNGFE